MIDPDAGPARWQLLAGASVILVLLVVMFAAQLPPVTLPASTPAPTAGYTWPAWEVGDRAATSWAVTAYEGIGNQYGAACEVQAGEKGRLLEVVGEAPDGFGLLFVEYRCLGWVELRALVRPR